MGKTSSAVKNRYNAKAYDSIAVRVHKGEKEQIQSRAASLGESVNGYICRLIAQDMDKIDGQKRTDQAEDDDFCERMYQDYLDDPGPEKDNDYPLEDCKRKWGID